jgi:hypothetical protein
MLLTEINTDDLNKLNQLRVERFFGLFSKSLSNCLLQVENEALSIHCYQAGIMGKLLDELSEVAYYARLVLGAQSISFNLLNEEVLLVETAEF